MFTIIDGPHKSEDSFIDQSEREKDSKEWQMDFWMVVRRRNEAVVYS